MKKSIYFSNIKPIIKKAGQSALKKWYKFDRQNSILKGEKDLVTKVDIETEKYLIKEIKKSFPSHGFLAEESGKQNFSASHVWFIDPIDGTTNFTIHNPLWSISIALAKDNDMIFGAIYFPLLDELFWAEKGKGAYLNQKKINLDKKLNPKKQIHTYCHGSGLKAKKQAIKYYKLQKLNSLDCRQLGSAAIECSYVACGRVDSLVIPGVNSWDVAAGALIAKEAGAKVLDFSGNNWSLNSQDILLCHPKLKKDILSVLQKL